MNREKNQLKGETEPLKNSGLRIRLDKKGKEDVMQKKDMDKIKHEHESQKNTNNER